MARQKKKNPRQMVNGIRRTKDLKRWESAVFTGKYNPNNKPIYEWITGDSYEEVEEKRNEIKSKVRNNLYVNPSDVTLGEYLDEWIKLREKSLAETTYDLYKSYIDKHIKPSLSDYKLSKIMPMTLQKFYNEKLEPGKDKVLKNGKIKKGITLKGKTVRKFHNLLHVALEDAKKNNLIVNNPADNVNPPKEEKFVPNVLSADDYFKLIDAVKGTYDEVYIVLAGGLGLRRGEVIGLSWGDIDSKNKTITIKQSITRLYKEVTKKPKNNSSFRVIAAPDYVLSILDEYKKSQKVIGIRVCDKYKPQSYSKHFKALLEKNGIPPVRFHDLRHFTAIILMMKGIPDKVVAEILGHAQVSTLREIYQHVIDEMRRTAAKTMDDFFSARN